jgi:hypothetical protein
MEMIHSTNPFTLPEFIWTPTQEDMKGRKSTSDKQQRSGGLNTENRLSMASGTTPAASLL